MYRRLSDDVALGLELAADGRSVLAIQRWQSRHALEQALSGPHFERWWSRYQPILAQWDAMVVFDSEWETIELLA
jgi:quinol monooxygenase YgiN